jgi:serine/threonine protein kinase
MDLPNLTEADVQAAIAGIELIGAPLRGGQKLVFPCTISGQRCALKVMLTNQFGPGGGSPEDASFEGLDQITARARREVETMRRCDSPHVVKLGPLPLTAADIRGQSVVYFSEEWIDGRDLKAIIRDDGPLPLTQVVNLGKHVTEAVGVLWSLAKIHRDIKPGNIMRRDATGDFVLLDMGLVFDLRDVSLTPAGLVPEQAEFANKRQMDFRSDLFSLGIVLYEAATGRHPFWEHGMSAPETLARILGSSAVGPSAHNSEIRPEMDEVILRLLAKRPHLRYRTCADLIAALDAIPLGTDGR